MSLELINEPVDFSMEEDEEGHKTYKVTVRVEDTSSEVGQAGVGFESPHSIRTLVRNTHPPGELLSSTGFESNNPEPWAYLLPNARVYRDPKVVGPTRFWLVDLTYTTRYVKRPVSSDEREDPYLERDKRSGGNVKYTEEATHDRHGKRITNSSLEQIRGPQNEWDMGRSTVRIEQISPTLELELVESAKNAVNSAEMWNLPARCWKLSDFTWDELFWAHQTIFRRVFTFESWTRKDPTTGLVGSGWDRDVLDEGTKVLRGRWQNFGTAATPIWSWVLVGNPNPANPGDYIRFQDQNGNITRVILDGTGRPYSPVAGATTTACTQCSSGAPTRWHVQNAWPVYYSSISWVVDGVAGNLIPHFVSCTWLQSNIQSPSNIINGGLISILLEYVAASSVWRLTVIGLRSAAGVDLGNQVWEKPAGSWNCLGANDLTGVEANSIFCPATATVSPAVASSPGTRRIEKYPQVDFIAQLRIPATLE
jgi:hypothetical protein